MNTITKRDISADPITFIYLLRTYMSVSSNTTNKHQEKNIDSFTFSVYIMSLISIYDICIEQHLLFSDV